MVIDGEHRSVVQDAPRASVPSDAVGHRRTPYRFVIGMQNRLLAPPTEDLATNPVLVSHLVATSHGTAGHRLGVSEPLFSSSEYVDVSAGVAQLAERFLRKE